MDNHTDIFKKLIPGLVDIFQQSITSIILYGSVARGTQTSESDVDVAVIIKDYTKDMHNQMIDFVVDLELEYDIVLSVLLINYDKFLEWGNVMPFYKNVKKEGIVLWPVA
jgi:predicted nucleotidyltransferase